MEYSAYEIRKKIEKFITSYCNMIDGMFDEEGVEEVSEKFAEDILKIKMDIERKE